MGSYASVVGIEKEAVRPRMAKNWIKGAIKHPGALRRAAARAGMSTRAYAEKHKHEGGTTGKRANLAITLMGMHHK